YFNQKHLGHHKPKFLWIPALATVLLIIWMRTAPVESLPAANASVSMANATSDITPPVTADSADNLEVSAATEAGAADESAINAVPVTASADDAIMNIVHTRCTTCHAAQPTQQGFAAPPAGIILQTPADMK